MLGEWETESRAFGALTAEPDIRGAIWAVDEQLHPFFLTAGITLSEWSMAHGSPFPPAISHLDHPSALQLPGGLERIQGVNLEEEMMAEQPLLAPRALLKSSMLLGSTKECRNPCGITARSAAAT